MSRGRASSVLTVLVCLSSFPLYGAETPEAALTNILAGDFGGDDDVRNGKVLHSDGTVWEGKGDGFDVVDDPLVIVSRWQIVGTQMPAPAEALVTVRTRVVATTEGQGDSRRIVPLAQPRDEDLSYRLWLRDGRWQRVDPPLPRVGFWAARDALANRVQGYDLSMPGNSKETLSHFRDELAEMESMAPGLTEKPDEFFSHLVAADIAGAFVHRYGHVLYTDGKQDVGDCGCSMPREAFFADGDPLIIVTRWQVVATRMQSPTKALVTVRYRTIATAEGQEDQRKIVPVPPRDEDVTYRLRQRKGRWVWVDPPPRARVGYQAVRDAVAKKADEFSDLLIKTDPSREDWRRALAGYRDELAALDALDPVATRESLPKE